MTSRHGSLTMAISQKKVQELIAVCFTRMDVSGGLWQTSEETDSNFSEGVNLPDGVGQAGR